VAGGERVSEWERGVRVPAVRLIPAVAAALGVSPLELFAMPNGVDLKALRFASGRTSAEIAAQVHVSPATYMRWESGRQQPPKDPATRRSLARALSVRLPQLEAAFETTTRDFPSK
jgi:transcriptional regulator with XRE-family HTH domain